MAVSLYTQPAQSNIINTYVPMPFQDILQAGIARQGRYDEGLAQMQAGQDYLDQVQAIEGSHREYLNKSKEEMAKLAMEYHNKDFSSPYLRRQFRDDLRARINPATIANIVESRKRFDTRNQQVLQLQAQNKYFLPYEQTKDPYLTGELAPNQLYDYTPSPFQDPDATAKEFFESISPDTRLAPDYDTGMLIEITEREDKKMRGAIKETAESYANTPQGQWIIDQYRRDTGDSKTSNKDIITNYLESKIPQYRARKENYAGAIPGWVSGQGSDALVTPFPTNLPGAVPGLMDRLDPAYTNAKDNRKAIEGTKSEIATKQSELAAAQGDVKDRIQSELDLLNNKLAGLEDVKNQALTNVGLKVELTDKDVKDIRAKLVSKYGNRYKDITMFDNDVALEIAKYLHSTLPNNHTSARESTEIDKYIDSNYPDLTNKEKNKIARLSKAALVEVKSILPTNKEIKAAFSTLPQSNETAGWIPPQVKVEGDGINKVGLIQSGSGKFVPSNSVNLLQGIQFNPERFETQVYNDKKGDWVTPDKDQLGEFKAGKFMKYSLLPSTPNEEGKQQLEFTVTDNEGRPGKTRYRVSLNDPSQLIMLGADYINSAREKGDPNWSIGFRLLNNGVSSSYMSKKYLKTKNIPISDPLIKNTPTEVIVKSNGDGTQSIYDINNQVFNSSTGSVFETDADVINALYELQLRILERATKVQQNAQNQ